MSRIIPDYKGNPEKLKQRIRAQSRALPDYYQTGHNAEDWWRKSLTDSHKYDALWEPLNDRILLRYVEPPAPAERSVIVSPQIAKEKATRCVVVRCGPGRLMKGGWRRKLDVLPGDEVQIGPYVDWESFDGRYAMAQEADIRVILRRGNGQADDRAA